ncbi:MAG: alpha-E domain-containing protein, partial [Halorhodospira sp.]
MLARLAEYAYWMARYLERAENTARLISTGTHLALDQPDSLRIDWQTLIDIFGGSQAEPPEPGVSAEHQAMRQLIPDSGHPSSIQATVRLAREDARTIRDQLPEELHEHLNKLHFHLQQGAEAAIQRQHRYPFLRAVIEHTQAIDGIINGTLARGPMYQFLMLGRFLERADMTTRLIEVRTATLPRDTLDSSPLRDDAVWVNVLRYLGAYSQYRQQRGLAIQGGKVVDFLLRDERFPRSVRFCLDALDAALRDLPAPAGPLEAVEAAGRRAQGPLAAGAATAELQER